MMREICSWWKKVRWQKGCLEVRHRSGITPWGYTQIEVMSDDEAIPIEVLQVISLIFCISVLSSSMTSSWCKYHDKCSTDHFILLSWARKNFQLQRSMLSIIRNDHWTAELHRLTSSFFTLQSAVLVSEFLWRLQLLYRDLHQQHLTCSCFCCCIRILISRGIYASIVRRSVSRSYVICNPWSIWTVLDPVTQSY